MAVHVVAMSLLNSSIAWIQSNGMVVEETLSVKKTLKDYKQYLARILRYARHLKLIDPYLKPEKEYLDTIEICSEMLSQRRESQDRLNCSIHIHAEEGRGLRYEYGTEYGTVENYFDKWEKKLHPLIEEYGHSFRVFLWKSGSNSMHDRFYSYRPVWNFCSMGAGLSKETQEGC